MHIQKALEELIQRAQERAGFLGAAPACEHPADLAHGDFSTNIAMVLAKTQKKSPLVLAEALVQEILVQKPVWLADVTAVAPGFINFTLAPSFFTDVVASVDEHFGRNTALAQKKVMVEYTDPNPFKVLHIGHLMSNAIGESLGRILAWSGAEVMRACYQGDVGMHVAMSLWGLIDLGKEHIPYDADVRTQIVYLGKAYAHGATAYKESGDAQIVEEIKRINKCVYEKTDAAIDELYAWGREVSLAYFELQYKKFGTFHDVAHDRAFNFYFFESETGPAGKALVEAHLADGVFEKSEGAIIFRGENHGLHTRVFLNSEGLPVYECKDLALTKIKYDIYPYDISVVVTGNEVNDYFEVMLCALRMIYPDLAQKTVHVGHGMLRLPSGKMSSRTGKVLAAEEILEEVLDDLRAREHVVRDEQALNAIAVAALKYAILKQAAGKNVIFDRDASLSFEGDSGPYLQYTAVRARAVLAKAGEMHLAPATAVRPDEVTDVERLLYRFPDVVAAARDAYSSHGIANFLIDLARAFNSWYAHTKILVPDDAATGYRLALTQSVAHVMENGLYLLGIEVPKKM